MERRSCSLHRRALWSTDHTDSGHHIAAEHRRQRTSPKDRRNRLAIFFVRHRPQVEVLAGLSIDVKGKGAPVSVFAEGPLAVGGCDPINPDPPILIASTFVNCIGTEPKDEVAPGTLIFLGLNQSDLSNRPSDFRAIIYEK